MDVTQAVLQLFVVICAKDHELRLVLSMFRQDVHTQTHPRAELLVCPEDLIIIGCDYVQHLDEVLDKRVSAIAKIYIFSIEVEIPNELLQSVDLVLLRLIALIITFFFLIIFFITLILKFTVSLVGNPQQLHKRILDVDDDWIKESAQTRQNEMDRKLIDGVPPDRILPIVEDIYVRECEISGRAKFEKLHVAFSSQSFQFVLF